MTYSVYHLTFILVWFKIHSEWICNIWKHSPIRRSMNRKFNTPFILYTLYSYQFSLPNGQLMESQIPLFILCIISDTQTVVQEQKIIYNELKCMNTTIFLFIFVKIVLYSHFGLNITGSFNAVWNEWTNFNSQVTYTFAKPREIYILWSLFQYSL